MEIKNRDDAKKIDKLWSILKKISETRNHLDPDEIIKQLGINIVKYNFYIKQLYQNGYIKIDKIKDYTGSIFVGFTEEGKFRTETNETFENEFIKNNEHLKREKYKEELDIRVKQDSIQHMKKTRNVSYVALTISGILLIWKLLEFILL